jgi:glycerol-3-phosphate acyltransferase PlsY
MRQHRGDQRRARDGQGLWRSRCWPADACKGFVPVWLGTPASACRPTAIALAGGAAIVGHMFTLFLRGRGGKGVATSLGVALALSPIAALVGFVAYVVVFAATRLSSLGSLLGVWTFALLFVLREQPARPLIALALGGAVAGDVRHRENIARLVRGEEKRADPETRGSAREAERDDHGLVAHRQREALCRDARAGAGDGVFRRRVDRNVDSIGTVRQGVPPRARAAAGLA